MQLATPIARPADGGPFFSRSATKAIAGSTVRKRPGRREHVEGLGTAVEVAAGRYFRKAMSNKAMTHARMRERPFQNNNGLRSISGRCGDLKNASLG